MSPVKILVFICMVALTAVKGHDESEANQNQLNKKDQGSFASVSLLATAVNLDGGIVVCPDTRFACPDGNTCCLMPNNQWVCCPLVRANCCPDGFHCCPYGHTCDSTSTRCNGDSSSMMLSLVLTGRGRKMK